MADIHQVLLNREVDHWSCPIACGDCCYRPRLEFCQPFQSNGMCVYHKEGQGCALPVERRPALCNFYLCDRALGRLDDGVRELWEDHRRRFMLDALADMNDHDPAVLTRLKQMLG